MSSPTSLRVRFLINKCDPDHSNDRQSRIDRLYADVREAMACIVPSVLWVASDTRHRTAHYRRGNTARVPDRWGNPNCTSITHFPHLRSIITRPRTRLLKGRLLRAARTAPDMPQNSAHEEDAKHLFAFPDIASSTRTIYAHTTHRLKTSTSP